MSSEEECGYVKRFPHHTHTHTHTHTLSALPPPCLFHPALKNQSHLNCDVGVQTAVNAKKSLILKKVETSITTVASLVAVHCQKAFYLRTTPCLHA